MERIQRLARINKDQLEIVNVVNNNIDKFGKFGHKIQDFREETINVSKKNIMELEMASKRDRIAWMHRQHEYEWKEFEEKTRYVQNEYF